MNCEPDPQEVDKAYDEGDFTQLAFDYAPIGLVVTENRVIRDSNKRFREMFQYSAEELQDKLFVFLYPSEEEFLNVLELTTHVIDKLGFEDFTAQISLRDPENKEKYIGSDENWDKAEQAIIEATAEAGLETITVLGEAEVGTQD